jgi:hypothetical protein
MKYYLELKDPIIVKYIPKFDEYGIIVNDGGHSFIVIKYCPWCGKELPKSKRDLWFKKLENLGFDDPVNQDIPIEFKTNKWYSKNNIAPRGVKIDRHPT